MRAMFEKSVYSISLAALAISQQSLLAADVSRVDRAPIVNLIDSRDPDLISRLGTEARQKLQDNVSWVWKHAVQDARISDEEKKDWPVIINLNLDVKQISSRSEATLYPLTTLQAQDVNLKAPIDVPLHRQPIFDFYQNARPYTFTLPVLTNDLQTATFEQEQHMAHLGFAYGQSRLMIEIIREQLLHSRSTSFQAVPEPSPEKQVESILHGATINVLIGFSRLGADHISIFPDRSAAKTNLLNACSRFAATIRNTSFDLTSEDSSESAVRQPAK